MGAERVLAVVLATTATGPGGVWRHVRDLGHGLRERGVRVAVALAPEAIGLVARAHEDGFEVTGLGAAHPGAVWHLHLPDTYQRSAPGLLLWARRRHRAVVLTEHLPRTDASDPSLAQRRARRGAWLAKTAFKRAQYALAHRVIAVSQGSRDFLLTRYGVPAARVRVVPNGVPVPATGRVYRGTTADPDRPVRVVALGRLIHQKGFDVLVAAAAASRAGWRVDVLGDGPAREPLVRKAAAHPSTVERIRFAGWTPDPAPVLAGADVAVLPSRWESAPYAALEAMAAGLPVVGTRVDGLTEAVVDGLTGLLVRPDDPLALAGALDTVCGDRQLAARMGANGYRRVRDRYDLGRMLDATLDVYAEARS